jgi:hypothetical protein
VVGRTGTTAKMPKTTPFFALKRCGQDIHITTIGLTGGAGGTCDNPRTGFFVS